MAAHRIRSSRELGGEDLHVPGCHSLTISLLSSPVATTVRGGNWEHASRHAARRRPARPARTRDPPGADEAVRTELPPSGVDARALARPHPHRAPDLSTD